MEIWKDIKDYEDCYEVSNMGRVRRKPGYVNVSECISPSGKRKINGKIIKLEKKRDGYLQVGLWKNSKAKKATVHRLVAIAFLENDDPEHKTEVNHINCNKQDNRAVNLEWVTPRQNKDHAKENNLYFSPRKKLVKCKQLNLTFESSYAAAEYINNKYFGNSKSVSNMSAKIRTCCLGKQKIAYGFNWEHC